MKSASHLSLVHRTDAELAMHPRFTQGGRVFLRDDQRPISNPRHLNQGCLITLLALSFTVLPVVVMAVLRLCVG